MRTQVFSTALALLLFLFNNGCTNTQDTPPHATAPATVGEGKVPSSFVCYVNNKYLGKEQIPVQVEGKTYYGCCKMCVATLQNNRDARYDKDPLTGEEVDKATAYIVLKPGGTGEVLYFQSEKNYQGYIKKESVK